MEGQHEEGYQLQTEVAKAQHVLKTHEQVWEGMLLVKGGPEEGERV